MMTSREMVHQALYILYCTQMAAFLGGLAAAALWLSGLLLSASDAALWWTGNAFLWFSAGYLILDAVSRYIQPQVMKWLNSHESG